MEQFLATTQDMWRLRQSKTKTVGGSPTAERLTEDGDLGDLNPGSLTQAASGSWGSIVQNIIDGILVSVGERISSGRGERLGTALARIYGETSPAGRRRVAQRLREAQRRQEQRLSSRISPPARGYNDAVVQAARGESPVRTMIADVARYAGREGAYEPPASRANAGAVSAAAVVANEDEPTAPDVRTVFGDATDRFEAVAKRRPNVIAAERFRKAANQWPEIFYYDPANRRDPLTVKEVLDRLSAPVD